MTWRAYVASFAVMFKSALDPVAATADVARVPRLHRGLARLALAFAMASAATPALAAPPDTIAAYLARIAANDRQGAHVGAIIVLATSEQISAQRWAARNGGPLAGLPVLLKDNIEAREWPTTAGSLALGGNATRRDAPLVTRLRAAGAVILGKANLSEWANARSPMSTSGWSAVGGLTRNPYATDRSACGSSSGSAAAIAAGFAWGAIGTETDGSITCPASMTGVVGLKPSVGLVSRALIVPISRDQDTAGPIAASVADVARLLTTIAGADDADPATTGNAAGHAIDFAAGLDHASLKGVRIGVMVRQIGPLPAVSALFGRACDDLARAGAMLVPIDYVEPDALGHDEGIALHYRLRQDLGAYLKALPGDPPVVRSLADVIAFDRAHGRTEMRWFGQEGLEVAQASTDPAAYERARAESLRLAGVDGIDRLLTQNHVEALIAPTAGPAWPIDLVTGDHFTGGIGIGSLAAIAGYPHLTVPMGAAERLPVGLSFIGAKWSDARMLALGAAYERARTAPLAPPTLRPWSTGE